MPFADTPWPKDLELPKLQHRGTQNLTKAGIGRIPGNLNKITRDLKEGILEGAAAWGADGEGAGGLSGYLAMCAGKHPKAYLNLLAKLMPLQVSGNGTGAVVPGVNINVVSIESGDYLSPEDVERLRSPSQPQPVEPTFTVIENSPPPEAPLPRKIETRTPEEKRLLAALESMDPEELLTRLGAALVNK